MVLRYSSSALTYCLRGDRDLDFVRDLDLLPLRLLFISFRNLSDIEITNENYFANYNYGIIIQYKKSLPFVKDKDK